MPIPATFFHQILGIFAESGRRRQAGPRTKGTGTRPHYTGGGREPAPFVLRCERCDERRPLTLSIGRSSPGWPTDKGCRHPAPARHFRRLHRPGGFQTAGVCPRVGNKKFKANLRGHGDGRGHEGLEKCHEHPLSLAAQSRKRLGRFFPFAAVNGDRLLERGRSTVVKIRAGITNSPERRGAPFLAAGTAAARRGRLGD